MGLIFERDDQRFYGTRIADLAEHLGCGYSSIAISIRERDDQWLQSFRGAFRLQLTNRPMPLLPVS
jgi:hypothetical protein